MAQFRKTFLKVIAEQWHAHQVIGILVAVAIHGQRACLLEAGAIEIAASEPRKGDQIDRFAVIEAVDHGPQLGPGIIIAPALQNTHFVVIDRVRAIGAVAWRHLHVIGAGMQYDLVHGTHADIEVDGAFVANGHELILSYVARSQARASASSPWWNSRCSPPVKNSVMRATRRSPDLSTIRATRAVSSRCRARKESSSQAAIGSTLSRPRSSTRSLSGLRSENRRSSCGIACSTSWEVTIPDNRSRTMSLA